MVCRVAQLVERIACETKAGRRFESCHGNKDLATELQGTVITKTTSIMKQRFLKWWHRNNMTFSAIAGETFTNGQVVCTHIGLVVFLMVAIAAGN